MARREIVDYVGCPTGVTVKSYEWKSQPALGPFTGKAIRAIAVKDEFGRFWGGIRFGASATEKARNEFGSKPFEFRNDAVNEARHSARAALSAEAEIYSQKIRPNAQPGKEIVRVTMDDGWSVAINAAGRISPAERRVMTLFDEMGKGKQPQQKDRGRGWPSR
jgi:hypothetical protein